MHRFRLLRAEEIDVRPQVVKPTGCSLLLYKDARVDMRLLDETFGSMNWQRTHELIDGQLFCNVDVWDEEKHAWVRKQDVGTESQKDSEKGRASDSFKRACFNLGIGRELYSAPFVWVALTDADFRNGALATYFSVARIGYSEAGEVNALTIRDQHGAVRFDWKAEGGTDEAPAAPAAAAAAELNSGKRPVKAGVMSATLKKLLAELKTAETMQDLEAMWKRAGGFRLISEYVDAYRLAFACLDVKHNVHSRDDLEKRWQLYKDFRQQPSFRKAVELKGKEYPGARSA